jgi:hypothetical protein
MSGFLTQRITDHGEHDPIPFDLGSWSAAAEQARETIESTTRRKLTDISILPRAVETAIARNGVRS